MSVHGSDYKVIHAVGVAPKVVNVVMKSLLLMGILANIYFLCFIDMCSDTNGSRNLHSHYTIFGIDLIVILMLLLLILHNFAFEGLNESKELLSLVVSQQNTDRFKPKEPRKKVSHILEKL